MKRTISRKVARWLVAALIFAQGAMVANACLAAKSARIASVASVEHEGCEMRKDNANICIVHCADQYNGSASPQVPPFSSAMAEWSPPVSSDSVVPRPEAWTPAALATGPPITIRNCCFRI